MYIHMWYCSELWNLSFWNGSNVHFKIVSTIDTFSQRIQDMPCISVIRLSEGQDFDPLQPPSTPVQYFCSCSRLSSNYQTPSDKIRTLWVLPRTHRQYSDLIRFTCSELKQTRHFSLLWAHSSTSGKLLQVNKSESLADKRHQKKPRGSAPL